MLLFLFIIFVFCYCFFFFFNDTATTEIYTLSLHDALPISSSIFRLASSSPVSIIPAYRIQGLLPSAGIMCRNRSEEHTSELQSPCNLVCRLLLEKKKLCSASCWTT